MSMCILDASDFRGVRERPSVAFSAEILFGEKRLILGTFDTAEQAARAYDTDEHADDAVLQTSEEDITESESESDE